MPPTKFHFNPTYMALGKVFEELYDGGHGGHLGYRNGLRPNKYKCVLGNGSENFR